MKNYCDLQTEVLGQELCCFCGSCAGICPTGKIKAENGRVFFGDEACVACGRCTAVCPGRDFDFPYFKKLLFVDDAKKESPFAGLYRRIIKGYASDKTIRCRASSGGALTALSLYLTETGILDGVVCVREVPGMPGKYEPAVLKTREEITAAAQSKYTLIPVNRILKKLLASEGRYLFIGLPCQIQGLQKAMEAEPRLKERVYLCASLFCGFNMTQEATRFLIRKSGLLSGEVEGIEYRAKEGAVTGFRAWTSQQSFFISKHGYTLLNMFFSPRRCLKCFDLTGEFADISFGDAWEMEGGGTRVIVRSALGEDAILGAQKAGYLTVAESREEDILSTQSKIVSYKKRGIAARVRLFAPFPDYHISFEKLSLPEYGKALVFGLCLKLGGTAPAKAILSCVPIRLLEYVSRRLRGNESGTPSEFLRYAFWGIVTVLVSLSSFRGLCLAGLEYQSANLCSILLTKTVAFLSNKTFVFRSRTKGTGDTIREGIRFLLSRGLTGIIEFLGLIGWVELLHLAEMPGKLFLLAITTALNYVLGKHYVFVRKKKGNVT